MGLKVKASYQLIEDDEGIPVEEQLIEAAARNLVRQDGVQRAAESQLREMLDKRILELLPKAIDEIIIQKTNSYGTPEGDPMSFQEYVVKEVQAWLINRGGSSSRGRLAMMVEDIMRKVIREDLTEAMQEAKATAVESVQGEGAKLIANVIARIGRM